MDSTQESTILAYVGLRDEVNRLAGTGKEPHRHACQIGLGIHLGVSGSRTASRRVFRTPCYKLGGVFPHRLCKNRRAEPDHGSGAELS